MNQFCLVAYIRVAPEGHEPLTYAEALAEKEQQEFLFPEHVFRIEKIPPVETQNLASLSHSDSIPQEVPCIPHESMRS